MKRKGKNHKNEEETEHQKSFNWTETTIDRLCTQISSVVSSWQQNLSRRGAKKSKLKYWLCSFEDCNKTFCLVLGVIGMQRTINFYLVTIKFGPFCKDFSFVSPLGSLMCEMIPSLPQFAAHFTTVFDFKFIKSIISFLCFYMLWKSWW